MFKILTILYWISVLWVAWQGQKRTIGFWPAFIISILLSPILGYLIILFFPMKGKVRYEVQREHQPFVETMGKPSFFEEEDRKQEDR